MKAAGRAQVLPTHTPALFRAAVERATQVLRAGGLVALPTETVYGLAANALDPSAVAQIFAVKGRPAHNPIIVHVVGLAMASRCVRQWPPVADGLASAFWPGPLTLVLPRSAAMPQEVTAAGDTVGVRWPSHPVIQAVIEACGFPLAAPSANLSSRVSPTTAQHVEKSLGNRIPLILDGGLCPVGIESTVVDLTVTPPRVLRPGMIHLDSLLTVIETTVPGAEPVSLNDAQTSASRLRSPGQLPRHYAPRAKLAVVSWENDDDLRGQLSGRGHRLSRIHVIAHTRIPSAQGLGSVRVLPHDPPAFARALYAELHHCDEAGAELTVVETPPDTPEWQAIHDRLKRAAA